MNNFLQRYELVISTLSPVHIGCGEDYEPTNYVMADNCLYPFHAIDERVFHDKQQRETFLGQCESIKGVWDIFHNPANLESLKALAGRYVAMNSSIQSKQKKRVEQNDPLLIVERTAFDRFSGAPILPGSGIKGAIRTAILEQQAEEKKFPGAERIRDKKEESLVQKTLMEGSFASDPLRLLKISDAGLTDAAFPEPTHILTRHSRHRKDNTKTSVSDSGQNFAECVLPYMAGAFRAELSLLENRRSWSEGKDNKNTTVRNFTIGNILKACNNYYLNRLKTHRETLQILGMEKWFDHITPLVEQAIREGRGFLLRTGKHAGADYLTIENYRRIQTKYEKWPTAKTLPISTTLCNDGNGFFPFGWIFVEVFEFGQQSPSPLQKGLRDLIDKGAESAMKARQERFTRLCQAYQENSKKRAEQTFLEVERQRTKQAAAERMAAQEAERERARQAAAERLASLSPHLQECEALRQKFAANAGRPKQPISGALYAEMRKLITVALDAAHAWTPEEKAELAAMLAEEHPRHIQLGGKEKEVKKLLRELRGETAA